MIDTEHDLAGCRRSHARLLDHLARLDDETAGQPSLLPGWTVAMLVRHLARNADSHRGMFEGAAVGEVRKQYPSTPERDADIERGRGLPAADVVADLTAAIAALDAAWDALPAERWSSFASTTGGEPNPVADLPFQRWREVEVHLVDLGLGFTHHEWDEAYVVAELDQSVAVLDGRLPAGTGAALTATDLGRRWTAGAERVTMQVEAPARDLLAWLLGRRTDGFPELAPWSWSKRA
jgi:maleylpyruvate isomerase